LQYVIFVARLNNILKIEAQKKEGKKVEFRFCILTYFLTQIAQPLNEEQLVLLTTRGTVEKALHDMEAMKAQLEELAREDVRITTRHLSMNSLL
jgi:hypothetical protein